MPLPKMTLNEWLSRISTTHPSEIELGLDRVRAVYDKQRFKSKPKLTVVVGGTNGKGSTIAMIEAALSAVGFKVGCYTSPHILNYNERVRLLGQNVSDERLVKAFEAVEIVRGDVALTYFEFGTLSALDILFNAELDVVLLEVGLGGRLDAVNVVDNDIAVITSVDFDHTDWLGETLQEIGTEKAGILRDGKYFIGGESLPKCVYDTAIKLSCRKLVYPQHFSEQNGTVYLSFAEKKVSCRYPKTHLPRSNVLVALQASALLIEHLDAELKFEDVVSEMLSALDCLFIAGRLEKAKDYPIFLDVAHNPHAARHLNNFIVAMQEKGKEVDVLYSSLGDKDIDSVVATVSPYVTKWLIAPLDAERAASIEVLGNIVRTQSKDVTEFDCIQDGLRNWIALNGNLDKKVQNRVLVVFGSFYTVEAAKRFLEK